MRKLLFSLMLVGTIGAVAQTVPAAAAVHSFSGLGVIEGTGTLGQLGDPTVQVLAFQFDQSATGETLITYPDGTLVAGHATCLFITGNTAYIRSQITRAQGPREQPEQWLPGNYIVIGIQASGSAGPELLNFSPGLASNPGCGPNAAATPVFPIVSGGFQVSGP
jgi:hypothetical protein